MKVYIGPYKYWFGPYQIAEKILFWRDADNDDSVHELGTKLSSWPLLVNICRYIEAKRSRKIKVCIDKYDTWSMDHTLAFIALPMLKQLKDNKHGAPFTDNIDVPEHLRSTEVPPVEEWQTDENFFKRWDWIMGEMIFAFESKVDDSWEDKFYKGGLYDRQGFKEYEDRIQNGFRLFGKYYQSLWD
jgi:hypothetical protein